MSSSSLLGKGIGMMFGDKGDDAAKKEAKRRKEELAREETARNLATKKAETSGSRAGFGFRTMFGGGESAPITRGTLFGN